MNYSNYKIFLDMHDISTQTSLAAKQGDTGRRIFVTLTERGVPFIIGENCTAVFTAKKPDGNIVFNNCTIENNIICRFGVLQEIISDNGSHFEGKV